MENSDQSAESALIPQISIRSVTYITSPPISASVLRQKYLTDRLSMRDIAHEFSCSKTHIRDLLLKHKIPLRQPYKYHDRWYAYGKRRVGGKTIEHKAELRTITTIKQMYSEGVSTTAITRCLNTMKIPTKQQGKGWHRNTVVKILKREGVLRREAQGKVKRGQRQCNHEHTHRCCPTEGSSVSLLNILQAAEGNRFQLCADCGRQCQVLGNGIIWATGE